MATILHIDTASSTASVSIAKDGIVLYSAENNLLNEHAAFLQPAIKELEKKAGIDLKQVDAIAVVDGPGSYTGLRVGLASAKGLAFALSKPLIAIGTLPLMAHAAAEANKKEDILYAPMIDARRMEVFTGVYDYHGNEKLTAVSLILNYDSYVALLLQNKLLFFGSGADKWKKICENGNALFTEDYSTIQSFAQMAFDAFKNQKFSDIAYSEPQYLKEFYNGN